MELVVMNSNQERVLRERRWAVMIRSRRDMGFPKCPRIQAMTVRMDSRSRSLQTVLIPGWIFEETKQIELVQQGFGRKEYQIDDVEIDPNTSHKLYQPQIWKVMPCLLRAVAHC